jgi:hypothetical protein
MFLLPEDEKERYKSALLLEEKNLMNSKFTTNLKRRDSNKSEKSNADKGMESKYNDYEKIVDIIFGEIVSSNKRKYIDYEEFEKILWTTNIDQSCVIHFD